MLSAELKDSVTLMLQTYGGHYLPAMTKKRTHLLLPHAHGDKYALAIRTGVKPVTVAWLVDSCHAGALSGEIVMQRAYFTCFMRVCMRCVHAPIGPVATSMLL